MAKIGRDRRFRQNRRIERTATPLTSELTADEVLGRDAEGRNLKAQPGIAVPPKATPFVDRPGRSGEWGVIPTKEGAGWPKDGEPIDGPLVIDSGDPSGQGQFIFPSDPNSKRLDEWRDVVDPANLPRGEIGTPAERREAAGGIKGLESERTRPNVLKEIARNITPFDTIIKPATEVRNPSHVKDLYAQSGLPTTYIEALAGQTPQLEIKENTRDLSFKEKWQAGMAQVEGGKAPEGHTEPRDYYRSTRTKVRKGDRPNKVTDISEIHQTSRVGWHSGTAEPSTGRTLVHETGHALSDLVSRAKGWYATRGDPRGHKGASPHEEGIADAVSEMYSTPEGPTAPNSPDSPNIYGIGAGDWRGDDPLFRHSYESTRLHTMGNMGTGDLPELETQSQGKHPAKGILQRLTNPENPYVRTMYGTSYHQGGADMYGEEVPFDQDAPDIGRTGEAQPTRYVERDNAQRQWTTAGRDFSENVLNKVQVSPARSDMERYGSYEEGLTDIHGNKRGEFRGEQQSMFPDTVPHQDLRENVRDIDAEHQRSGEDHLNRVKSNLKTWLV